MLPPLHPASLNPSWLFHQVVPSHTSKSVPKLLPPSERFCVFFFFCWYPLHSGVTSKFPQVPAHTCPHTSARPGKQQCLCLRGQSDRGSRVKACVIHVCQRQARVPARCRPVCAEQTKVLLTGSPFPCHCLGEAFLDHLFCPPEVVKLAGIRRISYQGISESVSLGRALRIRTLKITALIGSLRALLFCPHVPGLSPSRHS